MGLGRLKPALPVEATAGVLEFASGSTWFPLHARARGFRALERPGTVAIVGVGLIGGSIGLALRARGLSGRVIGIGRSEARLDEAVALGAIDEATTDLARGSPRPRSWSSARP